MIGARYQTYARRRDSGVGWIGGIPDHWRTERLGLLFQESNARAITRVEQQYPILSVSIHHGISDKEMDENELDRKVSRSDNRSLYKVVRENDLAYNMMRAWQGGFGAAKVAGLISPAYVVCRPRPGVGSAFFEQVLRTPNAISELKRFSRGITDFRLRLYWDDFKAIQVPVPPQDERQAILRFLDYETAKIDALIEKQQQLIALLDEKRQAVISHSVTKGLNPDAPMRDSGVEWLGEIPVHWEVKRLKHLFADSLRNGVSPQTAETGGAPTFSIAAVRGGVVDIASHMKHADISTHAARPYRVQQGDVMMMRGNGSRDLVGSVGIVNAPPPDGCIYPDILIRLRFSEEIDARLAVLFLNSSVSRPQVAMGAKTAAGIWKVSGATVAEFAITVPPADEQATILEHLNLTLRKTDDLVALVESQATLLQERRTALISAAVTGKIDVRGWRPPKSESEAEVA